MDERADDPWAELTELERQPLRGARRVVALRLSESWRNVVPVTLQRDLDISDVALRMEPSGPGLLDYVLFGISRVLVAYPAFNAVFDGSIRRVFAEVNIGLAVDTPRGLVVPVIRDVQRMSVGEIVDARRAATDLVVGWRHTVDDLIGGTFTVSNLGSLGVDFFTPIVNPPQVAILGLGRVRRQAVDWSKDRRPRVRRLLPASLTIDHRVLDGADGGRFLQALQLRLDRAPDAKEPLPSS